MFAFFFVLTTLDDLVMWWCRVIASVDCELVEPVPERPTEGFFGFSLVYSAAMGTLAGRPDDTALGISRVIERGVRDGRAVDTEALCVVAGESVWSIRTTLCVVADGGNVMDAANVAAVTALMHFRRPEVTIEGDKVIVHDPADRAPVPLSIHYMPIAVTFAFFPEGKSGAEEPLVVDPGSEEEAVCVSQLTMTLNAAKDICGVHKAGGEAVSPDRLVHCAKVAAVKALELTELIQAALEADEKEVLARRKRGNLYIGEETT